MFQVVGYLQPDQRLQPRVQLSQLPDHPRGLAQRYRCCHLLYYCQCCVVALSVVVVFVAVNDAVVGGGVEVAVNVGKDVVVAFFDVNDVVVVGIMEVAVNICHMIDFYLHLSQHIKNSSDPL